MTQSYWVAVTNRWGATEDRPLHFADGVAWIARTPDAWVHATPDEVERAEPMAHGHWGPRLSAVTA